LAKGSAQTPAGGAYRFPSWNKGNLLLREWRGAGRKKQGKGKGMGIGRQVRGHPCVFVNFP